MDATVNARVAPIISGKTPQAGDLAPGNALVAGMRLREFEIIETLGEGGFSIVYGARDLQLMRDVAIKEYIPISLAGRVASTTVRIRSEHNRETFEAGLNGFINEARLLAQFKHPGLVEVLQFWEENGTAYMVMPRYTGKTLRSVLKEMGGRGDEPWLRGIVAPVLDVLELLHSRNVFHRDIAPDNILIKNDGTPVLLDLGSAREVVTGLQKAITVVVKPGYAPIEQYSSDFALPQGPWTDVYAVGALLHFALIGSPPPASISRIMKDSLQPLASAGLSGYSREFLTAVDRALALQPNDRPQSIAELRDLLRVTKADKTVIALAVAEPLVIPEAPPALEIEAVLPEPPAPREPEDERTVIVSAQEVAELVKQLAGAKAAAAAAAAAAQAAATPAVNAAPIAAAPNTVPNAAPAAAAANAVQTGAVASVPPAAAIQNAVPAAAPNGVSAPPATPPAGAVGAAAVSQVASAAESISSALPPAAATPDASLAALLADLPPLDDVLASVEASSGQPASASAANAAAPLDSAAFAAAPVDAAALAAVSAASSLLASSPAAAPVAATTAQTAGPEPVAAFAQPVLQEPVAAFVPPAIPVPVAAIPPPLIPEPVAAFAEPVAPLVSAAPVIEASQAEAPVVSAQGYPSSVPAPGAFAAPAAEAAAPVIAPLPVSAAAVIPEPVSVAPLAAATMPVQPEPATLPPARSFVIDAASLSLAEPAPLAPPPVTAAAPVPVPEFTLEPMVVAEEPVPAEPQLVSEFRFEAELASKAVAAAATTAAPPHAAPAAASAPSAAADPDATVAMPLPRQLIEAAQNAAKSEAARHEAAKPETPKPEARRTPPPVAPAQLASRPQAATPPPASAPRPAAPANDATVVLSAPDAQALARALGTPTPAAKDTAGASALDLDPLAAPASQPKVESNSFPEMEDLLSGRLAPEARPVAVPAIRTPPAGTATENAAAAASAPNRAWVIPTVIAACLAVVGVFAFATWRLLSGSGEAPVPPPVVAETAPATPAATDPVASTPAPDAAANPAGVADAGTAAPGTTATATDPNAVASATPDPNAVATDPNAAVVSGTEPGATAPSAVDPSAPPLADVSLSTQPPPAETTSAALESPGQTLPMPPPPAAELPPAAVAAQSAAPAESAPAVASADTVKTVDVSGANPRRDSESSSRPRETASSSRPRRDAKPAAATAGNVKLSIQPWGEVWINGSLRGVSPPLRFLQLEPGTYNVELRNPGLQSLRRQLTVTAGQPTSIEHRFQPAGSGAAQ